VSISDSQRPRIWLPLQGVAAVRYRRGDKLRAVLVCARTTLLVSPVSREHHWVWTVPILILLAWQRHSVWRSLVFAATSVVDGPRLPDVAMPPPISGGPDAVREETADALSANTAFVDRTLPNSLILAFPAFRRPPAGGSSATPRRQADVASAV
jgi:hypothetical protein